MKFSLNYETGNQVKGAKLPKDFETISEARQWCDRHNVAYYICYITEYEQGELDPSGIPDIIAQCNFDEPAEENWKDLSKAINY